MNSNAEVPVQMVMPELNAGQPMQNENSSISSSTQSQAVIHSTMTMAQSPLQQQMQAIQQNLNANSAGSVQMVMSELNPQVQMVQNENITHSCSSQALMHNTVTMAQAPMQHVQVIPQAMSTPYFQNLYSPQQQVIFPGNLTLHTGTAPVVQSIAQNPNVQLQPKPELLNKVSVTGPTYQIVNAVTSKTFSNQNLIAKPLYSSSVPSPTQVSNANQLKQLSQPQMITTQASGTIYQPQVFGPFTQLPQNITWATPGTYQSPTLLSANVIIRNQHPEMFIQPSPQTTMIMPVASGTTQLPGGFTYALVQPQKHQQIAQKHLTVPQTQFQKATKVRNISPSVATQTNTNEKMKIAIPRTRVNQNVRPKGKITVPIQYNAALSSILPQPFTTDVQNQVQLGFQLETDVPNQTFSNLTTKSTASTETDSPILQNQLVSSDITQSLQNVTSKPEILSTPISFTRMAEKLKLEGRFDNSEVATNTLKPEKQIKMNMPVLDVSGPETHGSDCVQGKNESSKEKTNTDAGSAMLPNQLVSSEVIQSVPHVSSKPEVICEPEIISEPEVISAPIYVAQIIEKIKLDTSFDNSKVISSVPKSEKQTKISVPMSDISVPETPGSDVMEGNKDSSKEKPVYDLDIVVKKEPIESSPVIVEKEVNFKAVAQKEVVVNQADSSVINQNENDKCQTDNQQNNATGFVQPPSNSALIVENEILSQTEVESKSVVSEATCNIITENKCIEDQSDNSVVIESKIEKFETDLEVVESVPIEPLPISKEVSEKECVENFLKNLKNEFIEQEAFSEKQGDNVLKSSSPSHIVGKQKQRLKAVVRPHILTHVIDGFVIYESSEPFPVNRSALMSDSLPPLVPKIPDNSKKLKSSKHLSVKNPDEPTKPDDLKEPNEPTKTDFPKKRSDRIKLMETQKQLDLKKSEPKKPSESKKVVEPKTPSDQKKTNEPKTPVDVKKFDEPKKFEDTKQTDELNKIDSTTSPSDIKKPNLVTAPDNVPKTPGRRGRKRKELRSRRGRKKLIPDGDMTTSQVEVIFLDGENGPESDVVEDELTSAVETAQPEPVQTVNTDEMLKSLVQVVEKPPAKPVISEKPKDTEANKHKTFSEKLPTEWSVDDVCDFVRNIPNCQDYAEEFRSQEIDGKALLLLKVDHIVTFTSMKFGPALKLISLIDDMKEKYSLEV